MNVEEFAEMVRNVRQVEKALGKVYYPNDPTKIKVREHSRSLYVAEDIKKGEIITEKNVRCVRPGFGAHPKLLEKVIGCKVNRNLEKGDRFSEEYVQF